MISQSNLSSTDPIEEIILDDSAPENSDEKEDVKIIVEKSSTNKSDPSSQKNKSVLKRNLFLRGLLPPERDKSYPEILKLPVVKRCCIEHSYFVRKRHRSSRYFFRNSPAAESDTLQFENEKPTEQPTTTAESDTLQFGKKKPTEQPTTTAESDTLQFENEKPTEQPTTTDVECLSPKLKSVDESRNKNNVNGRKKRNSFSSSSCSSGSGRDSSVDDSNDRDYCPEDNSSDSDVASVYSYDIAKRIPKTDSRITLKNASDVGERAGGVNNTNAKKSPKKFYRVKLETFTNMEKLLKTKCVNDRTGKIPPPRLKKMIGQRGGENLLKMSDCVFPRTKVVENQNGEKNWRVEYMNDEVQSLGLDDLLLKASELNAENFTKALGRKLEPVQTNFYNKDSSGIVFTIPKSKKSADDGCEPVDGRSSTNNLKTINLNISRPFFASDKPNEAQTNAPEEASPKRLGIKVKTVQNINEEFKDSMKELEKELSLEKAGFDVPVKEQGGLEEFRGEGGQPFIMTIIQSKAERQRPAILRNSYLKKKMSLEKELVKDRILEKVVGCRAEGEPPPVGNPLQCEEPVDSLLEMSFENYVPYSEVLDEDDSIRIRVPEGEGRFTVKKRNIPFILNHSWKIWQSEASSASKTQNKLVKVNEGSEKPATTDKTFKITSVEQKLGPKETNRRFIKVVPYEPITKSGPPAKTTEIQQQNVSDEETEATEKDGKVNHLLSLTAFSTILKEILPDKWFLCLDKKLGLQIIKIHMDEFLNPSILISVVIARCGKLTVNVRGRQLPKSHELFSNICNMSNSDSKLSLNYVLAILNKLRLRSVCFGCDDPSLRKYWMEEGVVENQTESQQVYRSHFCMLLVSLGKRRCYPCYRMNESLKKRYRRDKFGEKPREDKETQEEEEQTQEEEEQTQEEEEQTEEEEEQTQEEEEQTQKEEEQTQEEEEQTDEEEEQTQEEEEQTQKEEEQTQEEEEKTQKEEEQTQEEGEQTQEEEEQTEEEEEEQTEEEEEQTEEEEEPTEEEGEQTQEEEQTEEEEEPTEEEGEQTQEEEEQTQEEKEQTQEEKEQTQEEEQLQRQPEQTTKTHHLPSRGMKRSLEYFLEESFSTMKQQIVDEIEKNKKLGERENALRAQEEVLSFMGLRRKESLDNSVRKSKRKKNSFYKLQQPVKKKIHQKELEFLEKYWADINTLFSTSLLFGAYSRTGRGRLREKCRMFQKLLCTWKNIMTSNPEWIGEVSFSDKFTDGERPPEKDQNGDQFEKMDVSALRTYIINSLKDVNRIKYKLRTKNSYFKVLYNKFVKRRMKRPKILSSNSQKKGTGSSETSTTNTPTPTDFSSDESSRDKLGAEEENPPESEPTATNGVSDAD